MLSNKKKLKTKTSYVEKREPLALLVGMQTGAAALENSVEVSQKIKNRTTLRPSNKTARNLPKGYGSADS